MSGICEPPAVAGNTGLYARLGGGAGLSGLAGLAGPANKCNISVSRLILFNQNI